MAVLTPPLSISMTCEVWVECSPYALGAVFIVISFIVQICSCLFDFHHFLGQIAQEKNTDTMIFLENVCCDMPSRPALTGGTKGRGNKEREDLV